jgi:CRP-like cAMP-binding protein
MGKCVSKSPQNESPPRSREISSPSFRAPSPESVGNLSLQPNLKKDTNTKALILTSLSKNPLFRDLDRFELEVIYSRFSYGVATAGTVLFEQGSVGSSFFIIQSGKVDVIVNGIKKGTLSRECCFGELALLSDSIRKATIKTVTKCSFWVLDREDFLNGMSRIFTKNYDKIRKIISEVPFFSRFPDSLKDKLSKIANFEKYKAGEVIIREGFDGCLLYILKSGCIGVSKNDKGLFTLSQPGDMFGERALLTGEDRMATCTSVEDSEVISFTKNKLIQVLGENFRIPLLMNIVKNTLSSDPHLSYLTKQKNLLLAEKMKWTTYGKGEVVIPANHQKLSCLIVVCVGQLLAKETVPQFINSCQAIGLGNLNEQNLLTKDYVAVEKSIVGKLLLSEIQEIIKIDVRGLLNSLEHVKFFQNVSIFKHFSIDSLKEMCESLAILSYKASEVIFYEDTDNKSLFVVKSGIIEIIKNNKIIRIIEKNESFGERCLVSNVRSASARCKTDCIVYSIDRNILLELKEKRVLDMELARKKYYQAEIQLDSAYIKSELKSIDQRRRYLIKHKHSKLLYEATLARKSQLESEMDCLRLVLEKEIMLKIDFPQIIKLVSFYHDRCFIYFITEHIEEVSLSSLLPLSNSAFRFYAMQFILILEYLHNKNIILRNFSTENFLIGQDGFPYLLNLQSAKEVKDRTYTRIGSPYYRSPEMIMGRGYSKATDYWSLGVVLYELVYEHLPFTITSEDPVVIVYEKILSVEHGFDPQKGTELNQVIESLLCDKENRLDGEGLRKHVFLSHHNYESLPIGTGNTLNLGISNKEKKNSPKNKQKLFLNTLLTVITIQRTSTGPRDPAIINFDWDHYF